MSWRIGAVTSPLDRIRKLVPPPSPAPDTDWRTVERALGFPLPTDYKEFIDTYGSSRWEDYLHVMAPGCPNDRYDLFAWKDWQTEAMEDLWAVEPRPAELQEAGTRIVPWATTDNGEMLYWLIRPGKRPEEWTVMINEGRGPQWEHIPHSCTQFLAAALAGDLRPVLLSEKQFPLPVHKVVPVN
nr:SMI1/KNR4 family protein [Nocardia transvalensis]